MLISYLHAYRYDVIPRYLFILVSGAFLFGRSLILYDIVLLRIIELRLGVVGDKDIYYISLHIAKNLIFLAHEKINTKNETHKKD